MDAIDVFARRVIKAQRAYDPSQGNSGWLSFIREKEEAFEDLVKAIPQILTLEDSRDRTVAVFWRPIQSWPASRWLPWLRSMVEEVLHKKLSCPDCGTQIKFPSKVCDSCAAVRKAKSKEQSRARRAVKQRLRACPECKTGKVQPRQRFCDVCKVTRRRRSWSRAKSGSRGNS